MSAAALLRNFYDTSQTGGRSTSATYLSCYDMVDRLEQEIVLPASSQVARIFRRYFEELEAIPRPGGPRLLPPRRGCFTLVYSSHNSEHNNAVARKQVLQQPLGKKAA